MSREFGSYANGYFHTQMVIAAQDCLDGKFEITRKWGGVLEEFKTIAFAISSAEAYDSFESEPILASIEKIGNIERKLEDLRKYLALFVMVSEEAVREHLKNTSVKDV